MKKITLKLFPILISTLFIFPILKENFCSLIVILLVLNTLLYCFATNSFSAFESKYLLLTIPFWLILSNSFFSNNFKVSIIHIQHSLLFLIIPVLFALIPKEFFTYRKLNFYISTLKNTCAIIAIVYVVSYFLNNPLWKFDAIYQNDSTFRNYIYNEFKLFVIHPTYYTTILILCLAHSVEMILSEKKYYQVVYLIIFLIVTFLLLTKLNIVFLINVLFFMLLFRNNLKPIIRILIMLFFVSVIVGLINYTPGIKLRFAELIYSFNVKPENVSFDSTNIRKAIFDSSLSIFKENWLHGVGFDELQNKLNNHYKLHYNSYFYVNNNYMTHNYYFYILLSTGVFGFLVYMFYLGYVIKICWQSNRFLLRIFIANALLICFVEDYFFRQYGIFYFNLILMTFIKNIESKPVEIR